MSVIDANGLTGSALIKKIKEYLDNVDIDFSVPVKSSNWHESDSRGEAYLDEELRIINLEGNMVAYLELPEEVTFRKWLDDDFEVKLVAKMDLDRYREVEFNNESYDLYEFYKIEIIDD